MKKMRFVETDSNNLRKALKDSCVRVLAEKYASDEAEFSSVDNIADNQDKFYVIPQSAEYNPFLFLESEPGIFSRDDIETATGIVFAFMAGQESVWGYQHFWSILAPKRYDDRRRAARIISRHNEDVFEEMSDPIITITEKIDLLVMKNHIITSDIKLMQRLFGFQDYIRLSAENTITIIEQRGIVANVEKLREYIQRGDGKLIYSKKFMRITNSKVLKMDSSVLWANIHNSKRWNGKIREENGRFVLNTYAQVESLVDLLDERYTVSEITGAEYDTSAKKPIEGEN